MKLLMTASVLILQISTLLSQNTASLNGEIMNPTGAKVYLLKTVMEDGKYNNVTIDSSEVTPEGNFKMTAEIEETVKMIFWDGNEHMDILLSPGDEIKLNFNTLYFDETFQFYGKGSEKNNAIVTLYLVDEANNVALNKYYAQDEVDTVALFEEVEENIESYSALVNDYILQLPEFEKFGKDLIVRQEDRFKQIQKRVAEQIAFNDKMKALLGKEAIDFTGIDLEGKKIKLSDFKGKMIVVDFWATWCGPCKAEFPAYLELEEKYGEEVNFVSVGVYCKEKEWKEMAEKEGFKNNIFLSKEMQDQIAPYDVKYIPRYLVIDKNFELVEYDAPRPSSGELQKYWKE